MKKLIFILFALALNAVEGYAQETYTGILNHTNHYLQIYPFSSTYDDGSYAKVFYDGNEKTLKFWNSEGGWTNLEADNIKSQGTVTGSFHHNSGYFELHPYSSNYDDGSYTKMYYDGNNKSIVLGNSVSGLLTGMKIGDLNVNGRLNINTSEATSTGWKETYINYKGHSLIVGSSIGAARTNALDVKPGGSSTKALNSMLRLFRANNENSHDELVRIHSGGDSFFNGGNVGIGTTNPDEKLTVKGSIHAEEVLVDLNVPGPDYVFEEDYPLQDLSSLEEYLKANKHLPEVPSASEMETEGIKVGEMEMLLLKKVEELTLHLIKQNKQIELLQSENKNQQNLIKDQQAALNLLLKQIENK